MSVVRDGARQAMAWLHGWTGLLLGWVMFIMCLAGTLSLFKPEIGRWMRPESPAAIASPADPRDAIVAATRWLAGHSRGSTGWYLTAPDARATMVEASFDSDGAYLTRTLDPVSGAPVARETLGGEFFYRLHFELELPYPWGRLLASLAAATMLTALVTGIIAHRRIFSDIFTFRPRKGQRSWLDGHNALGVLALPFHLMITLTGLLTLASLNLPWGIVAAYGSDPTPLYQDMNPGIVTRPASGIRLPLAPIGPMLVEAQRRFDGRGIGRVNIVNPGDKAAVVTVFSADADQIAASAAQVSFDGATGRMLASWKEHRPALQTYGVAYGLHMARFAPTLLRWLYALGGAMLTMAIATGLILWIVKRRERAPRLLGNRLLERLNVGVIAGAPIGCAAYLIANRLLPLGMTGRAAMESMVAMETAAGAMVAALLLPPRLAWPLLLGLLAAGCALAALIGPFRTADPVIAYGNLLLLGCSLALAPTIQFLVMRARRTA